MKATAYSYLKAKYSKKIVTKVFKVLELEKNKPMPIEHKRGSGSTTLEMLEIWLTKRVFNRDHVFVHGMPMEMVENVLESEGYTKEHCDIYEFNTNNEWSSFCKYYKNFKKELDGLIKK